MDHRRFGISALLISSLALAQTPVSKTLREDFDGDGKTDRLDFRSDGKSVEISIQGSKKSQKITLPIDPGSQGGLCQGKIDVSAHEASVSFGEMEDESLLDADSRKLLRAVEDLARKGMKGFSIENGDCDRFHYYFNPVSKRFEYWRA